MKQLPDAELFSKLRDTIRTGTYVIPDRLGYRGTGGPGLLLENILGFEPNNRDGPDSGKWEIKFHGGSSPLTLFHKTPEPKGNMHSFVRLCGWPDKHGRTSFRHTIYGKSERGFEIVSEGGRILIRNLNHRDLISPYWTHDTILNAFAYKLRRLAIVHGSVTKKSRTVTYESACLYWEPSITSFIDAVQQGIVAIDFDARTTDKNGLRDHGTKFRVAVKNLGKLYRKSRKLG